MYNVAGIGGGMVGGGHGTGTSSQSQGAPHSTGHHESDVLRNLMINYIPTQVDEAYLRQMFEAYGPVESVKIVYDKENNMSKGYGFVKYRSPQSASLAINNLNGYPILNKRLKVAYAKPEEAQRMLQQMHVEGTGSMGQPGTNMDPTQMQWMYYMQLQAQQLWIQQMQQMMLAGQQGSSGGQSSAGPTGLTPQQQQQMMMLVQQQQQQQQAQQHGSSGHQ